MKKIIYILILILTVSFSSCSGWLDLLPNNEQVTDDYWKSKEDVESVLSSGYFYMKNAVPTMISWGEVRGGTLYSNESKDNELQNFILTANSSICKYENIYKIINMANSVIKYAPGVMSEDDTYKLSVMNSNLCEAYFMRDFCYFLLVRNYRDIPLITEPYVDDSAPYSVAKSSEDTIIAQIKSDIKTALATGAAKSYYEDSWETKGRVTKWALYSLMADVCLWSKDYDECINYCDKILDASETFRPVFISDPNKWYTIFNPGNSNESIFELQWDYSKYNEKNKFGSWFVPGTSSSRYKFTSYAIEELTDETNEVILNHPSIDVSGRIGRMFNNTFISSAATMYYLWKYEMTEIPSPENPRQYEDANFILYRVADIILMKAEACIMKGPAYYQTALDLINRVHERAMLPAIDINVAETDQSKMMDYLMHEREMEFMGEGKRWYDLLRYSRINEDYKEKFINIMVQSNQTINDDWLKSVLTDDDALYMPIPAGELEVNSLLVQNPYYATTNN